MVVGVENIDLKRLQKILALTNSDKEGEAIAAFLMAKRLMAKWGLTFDGIVGFGEGPFEAEKPSDRTLVELELISLRKRSASLQAMLEDKSELLKRYEDAFGDLIDGVWSMHVATEAEEKVHVVVN